METAWYIILAVMITVYVVLDGFDLGAGALHLLVARNDQERKQVIKAIGPVWNGNEVWLVAAGGVLFMAFPKVYSGAFSGLYIGMILVLWLLIGRGLGLELRSQIDNPLWRSACDAVFSLASAALVLVLGAALGNVIRGVPLGSDGYFNMPLFEILNWYALLVGLLAVTLLASHGANLLAFRTRGEVANRARAWAKRLWWAQITMMIVLFFATLAERESLISNFGDHPWILIFPALAVGAAAYMLVAQARGLWGRSFIASCALILGMMCSVAATLFPNILPASGNPDNTMTVYNAAADSYVLNTAIIWWSIAAVLLAGYFIFTYRIFFRKPIEVEPGGD